ncbi:hypothetical protein B0H17DRAFT_1137132 [Mycena rosella]|uniref:Myb/SANT-like domain-containing protein n=1 Tax=Mycena rosella TaxID=1033263 RepID=A0AAD7D9C6_MYCRO|nr:hypothetical protein B0H17DRAFT_1137132 [Mycena rosella]
MAPAAEDTVDDTAGTDVGTGSLTSTKWVDAEVRAMLLELNTKKATQMSGNGFKPQVWVTVINKVNEANPNTTQKKDKGKCMNKLSYLKKIFDLYLFVQKFSGEGWDDGAKQATNTDEGVANSVKATGDNVLHLAKPKKKRSKKSTTAAPSSSSNNTIRPPLEPLANNSTNVPIEGQEPETTAGDGAFEGELNVIVASKKRERAPTDNESENDGIIKPLAKRQCSELGGSARRNAEVGTQISCALDKLSTIMVQPLVTSEDLSHVSEVVEILKDKILLPDDPRGKLYRTAWLFILEEDRTRRIGLLEGILEDAGLL